MNAGTLLELQDVSMAFGGLRALDEVSFSVYPGEILGLIGPNGSGKSTAFNVITGTLKATGGTIVFSGEEITGMAPHIIAKRGISRTFQVVRPFAHLTALENVLTGKLFGAGGGRRTADSVEEARATLERVGLAGKADVLAADLTILERKWLEVGRALAGGPQLILLDEFMAGIAQSEVPDAVALVRSINELGVTVVLVEHIIKAITSACERVIVLDAGRKLAEGPVAEVVENLDVIEAYLGSRHAGG